MRAKLSVVDGLDAFPVKTLTQATGFLQDEQLIEPLRLNADDLFQAQSNAYDTDFKNYRPREHQHELEIACGGWP